MSNKTIKKITFKIIFQSVGTVGVLKAFPSKIVASIIFLIKMASNELMCHYIEVIKTSIITVLLAI